MKRFLILLLLVLPGFLYSQDKMALDSLQIQLEHSKEDSTRVKILWNLSSYYLDFDLRKALDYSFQALETANEMEDRFFTASSYSKLGNVFLLVGIHNEALKNFFKSLEIFEEIGNEVHLFSVYKDLGNVYYSISDFDESLKYYFKALSVYNNFSGSGKSVMEEKIIGLYTNIGSAYGQKSELETASQYFTNALDLANKNNDYYNLGVVCNNLGKIALVLNRKDEAYNYFQRAIKYGIKGNHLDVLINANIFLANYYLAIEDTDNALDVTEKANSFAYEFGSKGVKPYVSMLFFQIYQKRKEYEKALAAYVCYKQLSDSLQSEANLKEQVGLQLQYEFDKKEKIRVAEQQKRELKYFLVISILTLMVIITGLLYSLLKNRTRRIHLEKKQLSLEKENLEKDLEVKKKDLEIKNKELTTNVMYLVQKNETISNISNKLLDLKKRMKLVNQKPLQEIILELQGVVDTEVWEEFEYRFQQVHTQFYAVLQDKFPDLTPGDKKLAAFLRLNLTTKEIAAILGLSINSVDVARYRLRKKLGLANKDINLVNFLSDLA